MKLTVAAAYFATMLGSCTSPINAQGQMVKMCLFYGSPSGYARSDPIITQTCASGHVHTFYGPLNFHPNTSYEDIRDTLPEFSTTPFIENQSLYWHPTIYEVVDNADGTQTFTRAPRMDTSPYYRWDNSVLPLTETFPPGFRMIAASNDPGANAGGERGENMFTECCNVSDGGEECDAWERLEFPSRNCDFLGIALAMPTCWDGVSLGDDNDHKSHMAYTVNGKVAGACPDGFNHRLPQIQVFVRVHNYRGSDRSYQLSDGQSEWHVDFMNGWEEGKLAEIIQRCPVSDQELDEYNPECGCDEFLTPNDNPSGPMCDRDVRRLIIDEATDTTSTLPSDTCQGQVIEKSWDGPNLSTASLNDCGGGGDTGESGEDRDEAGDDTDENGNSSNEIGDNGNENNDGSEESSDGSDESGVDSFFVGLFRNGIINKSNSDKSDDGSDESSDNSNESGDSSDESGDGSDESSVSSLRGGLFRNGIIKRNEGKRK